MGGRGSSGMAGGIPSSAPRKTSITNEEIASGEVMKAFLASKLQSVVDYPEIEGQIYNELHTVTMGNVKGAAGFYSRSEKKIAIDKNLSMAEKRETVAHELGHALAINPPSGFNSDEATFNKAFKEYKQTNPRATEYSFSTKISSYAGTAKSEAFAEAFMDVSVNGKGAAKESKLIMKHWKK